MSSRPKPLAESQPLSPQEFAERFQRESRILWCVAAGIVGDPVGAEDVLQEACVVALEKLGDFEPGTNFNAWMSRIVRYVALNQMRKTRSRRTTETSPADASRLDEFAERDEPERTPVATNGRLIAGQDAFDDRVVQALAGVGELARACLLMRVVGELDYREISETLSIPEGTAMSHVFRARASMRAALDAERSDA